MHRRWICGELEILILTAMQNILLVGLGGFLGSIARYGLGGIVLHWTAQERFPWSTFAVNVTGCLLGGFTTFSAFGLEAINLVRRGEVGTAALYAGGSVVLGMMAVWLGLKCMSMLPR